MRPVRIKIELADGGVIERELTTSPIQLGRNPKADVHLPYDFVSSWHGMIRFDETSACYFDLGSTNGTERDGQRIGPGQEVAFEGPVRLQISELTLTLERVGEPASERTAAGVGVPEPTQAPKGPPTRPIRPPPVAAEGDMGMALIGQLSARLLPSAPPPQTIDEAQSLLERVERLLQTCARGVVEMQAGQERMGHEIGVQTVKHYTGLRFATTAPAALEYLLSDTGAGDERRLQELAVGFSDAMSHQIALLNGVVEGARAVVQQLDPGTIERETAAGRIGRHRELWAAFASRWERLATEEKVLLSVLFGPEFGRVYAEVGGELSAGWQRSKDDDEREPLRDGATRG